MRYTKLKRQLAGLLIAVLLLLAMPLPAAVAESKAYYATTDGTLYSDAAMTQSVGALRKYDVFKVLNMINTCALIELYGQCFYTSPAWIRSLSDATEGYLTDSCKVYLQADTSSAFITAPKGLPVHLVRINDVWAHVEYNGVGGYVEKRYFSESSEWDFPETPAPTEIPSGGEVVFEVFPASVTADSLQVYNGIDSVSSVIGTLKKGTTVRVNAYNSQWAAISLNDAMGYVLVSGLERLPVTEVYVKTSSLKVYSEPTETAEGLGTVSYGTVMNLIGVSDGWAYIELNSRFGYCAADGLYIPGQPTPAPTATPVPTAAPTATPAPTVKPSVPEGCVAGIVQVSSLNVFRDASGKNYYGTLVRGDQVNVISVRGSVAYVERGGMFGYCIADGLAMNGTPATGMVKMQVGVQSLPAYSTPGDSTPVGTLAYGNQVEVFNVVSGWAFVNYNGVFCWCDATKLKDPGSDPTPTAIPTAVPTAVPTSVPSNCVAAIVKTSRLDVFRDPSGRNYYGTLVKGDQVTVISVQGSVAYVERGGMFGYCIADGLTMNGTPVTGYVEKQVGVQQLQVFNTPNDAAPIGQLSKGTRVSVFNVVNGLAFIGYNGVFCWCDASKLTDPGSTPTPVPTAAPTVAPTSVPTNCVAGIVKADKLDVFCDASGKNYYGTLVKGDQVVVISVQGSVAYVERSGLYGYCMANGLTMNGTPATGSVRKQVAAQSLPVFDTPNAASSIGQVGYGTQVTVYNVINGWAFVNCNGVFCWCDASKLTDPGSDPTPTVAPTVAPTAAPTSVPTNCVAGIVKVDKLNVFYDPAKVSYYGSLGKGELVTVISVQGNVAYVERNGMYGYCNTDGLTMNGTPPTGALVKQVDAQSLTIYDNPINHSPIGQLGKGTQVSVYNVVSGWAFINSGSLFGWCDATKLKDPGGDLPTGDFIYEQFNASVVSGQAKLYAGPSTSHSSVSVPRGKDFEVVAYNKTFAYGSVDGVKGYMLITELNRNEYATLSQGNSGQAVQVLCMALLSRGFYDARPESTYSSYTTEAVKLFQKACGLSQTGVADKITQRILYSDHAPKDSLMSGTFQKGSKGDSVTRIQLRLYALGYLSKTTSVDGDFGNNTYSAVYMFQDANHLTTTGVADPGTIAVMYSTSAVSLPSGKTPADGGGGSPEINPGNQQNNVAWISETLASKTSSYSSSMSLAQKLEYVIYCAQNQLGKPYVYGNSGPNSYDCTGLTCYGFKQIGVSLPRTAKDQGYSETFPKVTNPANLTRGDLVYFDTVSDSDLSDHAGIYLGAGYFIHASSGQGKVVVSTLASGYYSRVFSWGRHIG